MLDAVIDEDAERVALLAEGVDRNWIACAMPEPEVVALLAEGVDRNRAARGDTKGGQVALLAEGVDRNLFIGANDPSLGSRPPRGGRG